MKKLKSLLFLCGFFASPLWFTPAFAEDFRVAVLGDSFAAGYGLSAEDGFCGQLEKALTEELEAVETVSILCAGLSGDTSQGGLSRAPTLFEQEFDALILELGANDMLRGVDPERVYENLSEIIAASPTPVFVLGMRAYPTYGKEYVTAFDAIYPRLSETTGAGLYPFVFEALLAEDASPAWNYFQADGLHPNADGVKKIVSDIAPELLSWASQEGLVKSQSSFETPKEDPQL